MIGYRHLRRSSVGLVSLVLLAVACGPRQAPPDRPLAVQFDAIEGLTTRSHAVPADQPLPVPLGKSVTLRVSGDQATGTTYRWRGATALADSRSASSAVFAATTPGLHEIEVLPARGQPKRVRIQVIDVAPEAVRITIQDRHRLATHRGGPIVCRAAAEPREFAALVEWDAPDFDPPRGFGPQYSGRHKSPRSSPSILAGLGSYQSERAQPVLYTVHWVVKPQKENYFSSVASIRLYHEIRTDPPGYEGNVAWTYDTVGTGIASATTGVGRSFTVVRTIDRKHPLLCWRVTAGDRSDGADEPNRSRPSPLLGKENQEPKNQENCSSSHSIPVTLSNGEVKYAVEDMRVKSRGFDFVWRRSYSSRANSEGSLGFNWQLNYNSWVGRLHNVRREPIGWTLADGGFREDTWMYNSLPPGYYEDFVLVDRNGVLARRVLADGTVYTYGYSGHLIAIADRAGNTLKIERNSFGNITKIIDTQDRVYVVVYTHNQPGQKIASLTDFAGRTVRYFYDSRGDLVRVQSPIVDSTPNGNDYPAGKSTLYTYSQGMADTRLNHNLLTITEPAYNVGHSPDASKPLVQIVYSPTTNSASAEFDHVIAERWGHDEGGPPSNPKLVVGGTARFAYVDDLRNDPDAPFGANLRTTETTRNGNTIVHYFDQADTEIKTIERTNRDVRPGEGDYVTTRAFSGEGQLLSMRLPRGNRIDYGYDSASRMRRSEGNLLLTRRLTMGVGGGGVDLVTYMTYDPVFNQLHTVSDPRAFPTGNVPLVNGRLDLANPTVARYTTTHVFDYQESSGFQQQRGVPAELRIPEGLGDQNGATDFNAGNVVKTIHPTIQTEGPNKGQTITELRTWNDRGQVLTKTDPQGQVETYAYYASNSRPNDPSDREGYLQSMTTDAANLRLTTSYGYDTRGNLTDVTDPKGQTATFFVNQLDQVVRSLSRPVLSAVRYQTDWFYDANDNLMRTETSNLDGDGRAYSHKLIVDEYEYDIVHNVVSVIIDKTRNDGSSAGSARTSLFYDGQTNRIAVRLPKPVLSQREPTIVTTQYDERDLPYKRIIGDSDTDPYNAPPAGAVVVTSNYDENRNLLETIDSIKQTKRGGPTPKFPGTASGDVWQLEHDGHDRRKRMVDAEGGVYAWEWDLASNPTAFGLTGPIDHTQSAPSRLLMRRAADYDERNCIVRIHALHVDETGADVGDGASTTTYEYDKEGKLVGRTDDRGLKTTMVWDGADRLLGRIDALGNQTELRYDKNGNVISRIQRDVSSDLSSGVDVFTTTLAYDGIDRLIEVVDPAGGTTTGFRDSRGNLVRVSDSVRDQTATGNVVSYDFDALDRLVRTERILTSNGRGSGSQVGRIVTTQAWDDDSRLVAQTDDNGHATVYGRDNLGRIVSIAYADGTRRTVRFNADDQEAGWTDANGTDCRMTYDGLSRLLERQATRGQGVLGATVERFHYDGAGRPTLVQSDDIFRSTLMDCVFAYDSLSNRTRDQQGSHVVRSSFDGMSNRVACSYPADFHTSGRRLLQATFDGLNRLRSVTDGQGPIATVLYRGPRRLERRIYGPAASPISLLDCGYDRLPRQIDLNHRTGANTPIARFQYGYDRMHHRLFEKRVHESNTGDVFAYDSVYRVGLDKQKVDLTSVSAGQEIRPETFTSKDSLGYQYDGVGNRRQVVQTINDVGTTTVYQQGSGDAEVNQYTSLKEGNKPQVDFTYDENGNLIADGTRKYAYDFKNRLVEARDQATNAVLVRYSYDPDDRRVMKVLQPTSTSPTTVVYVYDGDQCVEERDGTDKLTRQLVWGGGVDELWQVKTGVALSQTLFAHQSSVGNVAALVDGNGNAVERYAYDPFGNTTVTLNGATGNEYRFHGARFDPETGLYHMRARQFSPPIGRFLQRDPIGIWTDKINLGNGYTLAGNSPVNWRDPNGMSAEDVREIEDTFNSSVQRMTDSGQRRSPGWLNNMSRSLNDWSFGSLGSPFLGCGEQVDVVQQDLQAREYDDVWTFSWEGRYDPLPHQRIRATSSNPNDPILIIDPHRNEFEPHSAAEAQPTK